MKRIFLLLLTFLSCFILITESSLAAGYAGGSGTSEDPYQIATLAQLRQLSETSGDWDKSFILTADIDASDTKTWNGGKGFSPIGNESTFFGGTFDGDHHAVENIYINKSANYVGVFGKINKATIKNLKLTNCQIKISVYSGGLVGFAQGSSKIDSCFISGNINITAGNAGGIVGASYGTTINRCYAECTISASSVGNVGAIVGYAKSNSKITNCFSNSTVTGKDGVGNIAGYLDNSSITNCLSFGTITGVSDLGGIAGKCYSRSIENCYVAAKVVNNGQTNVGVIAGSNYVTISDCYYDKTVNPNLGAVSNASNANVTGLITNEFAKQNNFSNWDFGSTWGVVAIESVDDVIRPYFQWMYDHIVIFETDETKGSISGSNRQGVTDGLNATEVTAVPTADYHFVEWQDASGNSISSNDNLTVTNVTCDTTLTAVFLSNYGGGSGTSDDPFQIATLEQLRLLSETAGDWDEYFILTADIDATDTKNWNNGTGFSPIGDYEYGNRQKVQFTGNFNGNNHIISNLYINRGEDDYVGLIGYSDYATIKNLNLINCNITCTGKFIGSIIGYSRYGSISKCYCAGNINGGSYIGGIVGEASSLSINSCYTNCSISGEVKGGVIGESFYSTTIQNCLVLGDCIDGSGLVAAMHMGGTIKNSYVAGKVIKKDALNIGILAGLINTSTTITNCYYDSTVNPNIEAANIKTNNATPLTTSELADKTNFTDWDFESTWKILALTGTDSIKRPNLQWAYDHVVTFMLGANGDSIVGADMQGVDDGADASAVKALGVGGYALKEWTDGNGNVISTDNPLTITNITRDSTLYAVFQAGFEVEFGTDGNGTIDGDTYQGITSGGDASSVTAIANTGYLFNEWQTASGDSLTNENPIKITNVTRDSTLTAVFLKTYNVSFSTDGHGTISGTPEQTVVSGASAGAVTATAVTGGYSFVEWQDAAGNQYSTANPLTIENVTKNVALTAIFEEDSSTGIGKSGYEKLSIYPNPTDGEVNIALESGVQSVGLSVYSVTGEQVYSDPAFTGGKVDLSSLSKGIYLVKVSFDGKTSVAKLIRK
jgi:hypothetical protein